MPLSYRDARLPGGDDALVGDHRGRRPAARRYVYDGPRDPVFAEVLLQSMLAETSRGLRGDADGATRAGSPAAGSPALTVGASRVLRGEQSNTSIIYDTTTVTAAHNR